jgi:pectin methylesterase-like acyl-CoA thioesterase
MTRLAGAKRFAPPSRSRLFSLNEKNLYNFAGERRKADQAVAALVGGDRDAFYGCAFHGFQDTLCDYQGRHYFRRCVVTGGVDFIFGYGQSIYDACTVVSVMPPGPQPGWVTAHARDGAASPGGLVFRGGAVVGAGGGGRTYLGRAWNRYATVVFYRTRMDDAVVPQGWQAWNAGTDV